MNNEKTTAEDIFECKMCITDLETGQKSKEISIADLVFKDYIELKNQQKEFIEWLEENWKATQDIWYVKILNIYKETIGVTNEKYTIHLRNLY